MKEEQAAMSDIGRLMLEHWRQHVDGLAFSSLPASIAEYGSDCLKLTNVLQKSAQSGHPVHSRSVQPAVQGLALQTTSADPDASFGCQQQQQHQQQEKPDSEESRTTSHSKSLSQHRKAGHNVSG